MITRKEKSANPARSQNIKSLNIINVHRINPASAYHATVGPHVISSSTDEINKSNSRDDEQIAQTLLLLLFPSWDSLVNLNLLPSGMWILVPAII